MPFGSHYTLVDPGSQSNYDGDVVALTVATLSNGNNTNISASGLPSGLSLSGGVISGTIASNADVSSPFSSIVSVTDMVASVTTIETIAWAVSKPSVTMANPGDQNNFNSDTVSLSIAASDSANHALVYSATGLPSGLSINSSSGVITGTIASNADAGSPFSPTITATDVGANLSMSRTVGWVVSKTSVSLGQPEYYGDQGETVAITATLAAVSTQDVTVQYATSDDTAEAGTDYTAVADTLTIRAGQTSATFTIPILSAESTVDGVEFNVALSNPSNANLGNIAQSTVTILVPSNSDTDPAQDLTQLNNYADWMWSMLYNGDDNPSTGGVGTTSVAGVVGQIKSIIDQMSAAQTSTAYHQLVMNLGPQITALLALGREINREANAAGALVDGEQFRIEGIQADLDQLNEQLDYVVSLLGGQITGWGWTPGDADFMSLSGWVIQLEACATANGTTSFNTTAGNAAITNLNGIYTTLNEDWETVSDAAAEVNDTDFPAMSFDLAGAAVGVDTSEDYNSRLGDLSQQESKMVTAAGDGTPNAEGTDAFNVATAALDAVGGDSFAQQGVMYLVVGIYNDMESVYNGVAAQYAGLTYLENNFGVSVPAGWFMDLSGWGAALAASGNPLFFQQYSVYY